MTGIVPDVNLLAFTAAEAAYQHGEPWRKALLAYLRKNRDVVQTAISTMPGLEMKPVEATYLAWIDTRTADLGNPSKFFEKAGVGLNNGSDFGLSGFVRLNFGCPRVTLETGLNRMARAMETIR
jgi:cystathionine beta-lyase